MTDQSSIAIKKSLRLFGRNSTQLALNALQRKAQGKRISIDRSTQRSLQFLLGKSPEFRKAHSAGVLLRQRAIGLPTTPEELKRFQREGVRRSVGKVDVKRFIAFSQRLKEQIRAGMTKEQRIKLATELTKLRKEQILRERKRAIDLFKKAKEKLRIKKEIKPPTITKPPLLKAKVKKPIFKFGKISIVKEDIPKIPKIKRLTVEESQKINDLLREQARQKGVWNLVQEGKLPDAVIRSAEIGAKKLLTVSDLLKRKVFGGKKPTEAQLEKSAVLFAELGLFVGFSPLLTTTGELVAKLPKKTSVRFVGKQKTKGNAIVTDVVFESSGKRIGVARGVTIPKGKESVTLTVGKTARRIRRVRLPSGKITTKLKDIRGFLGKEISKVKPATIEVTRKIRIGKGTIKVKQNIQALTQTGFGRVIQFKKNKLVTTTLKIPTTKAKTTLAKSVNVDDFISMAAIFNKKDISLITGKTLTKNKDIITFLGLIKGQRGVGTLTSSQKVLFNKALANVISVASSATKAKSIKGLSSAAKSAIAAGTVRLTRVRIPKTKITTPRIIQKVKPKPKPKPTPTVTKAAAIPITAIRSISKLRTKLKQAQKQKQVQKVKQIQKQIQGQKLKQKALQLLRQLQRARQKQKQKLLQRLKTVQRQVQKQKFKFKINIPTILKKGKIIITPPLIFRIKRRKIKKGKKKKVAYDVFARPTKKTKKGKRPKLIKINKAPLTKSRAKDMRNYLLDTSLARTGKIKARKGIPKKVKLRGIPVGYAKRTSKKFRRFKQVKGKRKLLTKGKVIEKRTRLLDTRQEKRGITLRKRLKQLRPRRVRRDIPIKRIKRKPSPAQLKALAKGRRILKSRRRK